MPSNLFGSFQGPEDIEKSLNKTFLKFGSDAKAKVTPAFEWGNNGKKNLQNQYFLEVNSVTNPGEQNTFFATIKMGKDNNVFVKQGSGWQLFTGDLGSVTEGGGIAGWDSGSNQQLFNQGIDSLGMRIAAANYMSKQEQGTQYQSPIKSYFHEVNQGIEGTFSGITIPGFGRIAPSRVFVNNQTSEEGLWRLENTLNTDIIGRAENVAKAITKQVGNRAAEFLDSIDIDDYMNGNAALIGGALDTQRGRYQKKAGFGTPYRIQDPGGVTSTLAVAGMTEKIKQSYVWGGRENAAILGVGNGRMEILDNPYVRQANMPLRPGGKIRSGLLSNVLVPRFALPWQSGMGIYNAPAPLREMLSDKGMGLAAGYASQMKFDIAGVDDISKLASSFQLDKGLIGKVLETNSPIRFGSYTDPSGKVTDLTKTTEQQTTGIMGYSIDLPASMRSQVLGTSAGTISPYMVQLNNVGFSSVSFNNESNQASVIANTMYASTPGFKGLGFKASITPLVGQQNEDFDAILESKNISATTFGIMQGMKKEGIGGLYNMINMLYGNKYASEIETFRQGGNQSYEGLGRVVGFQAPELFIGDVASKLINADEGTAKTLSEIYNIKRVTKLARLQQFTAETMGMYKENAIAALMQTGYGKETDKIEKGLSRQEAERVFNEKNIFEYDEKNDLYTQKVTVEGLQADVLMNFTSELEGLGSNQGQYEQGMEAQGFNDVHDFLKTNKSGLYPITPGKRALQEFASSYMHTTGSGAVDPNASYIISGRGKGGIDATTLLGHIRSAPTGTDIEKAKYIQGIINQMAGAKEGAPSRTLRMEGQAITIPSLDAAVEVDDITKEINDAGEMTSASNAMATKQYLKFFESLVSAEAEGERDPKAYNKALSFMKKYIKSDALVKDYGGIFTRPTGSNLINPSQVVLNEAAIRRNYMIMANRQTPEGWKEYRQKIAQGAYGISIRPPNTVIGSEGSPGSVMLQEILTPDSMRGNQILQSYTQSGMIQPQMVISAQGMTTMGDLDYDPYMLLPLGYQDKKGGWNFYQPKENTPEARKEFIDRLKQHTSIKQQRKAFSDIYGQYALHYNPMDLAARSFFGGIGLDEKGDLYNRSVSADMKKLNKSISEQNYQKTMAMGTTFNNYIRSLEEASVTLGVPQKQVVQARDLASQYYQEAVDMEHVNTPFEKIMGSLSWSRSGNRMNAGYYAGDNGTDWRTVWEPTSSTGGDLGTALAQTLAMQPKMTPKLFAGMMTTIPELEPGQSEKERGQIIETRRKYVESALNQMGDKFTDPGSSELRGQILQNLRDEGYIGENAPAPRTMYRRLADYALNNPELHDMLQAQSVDASGNPMMNAYGKKMDYNEFAQRTRSQQLLHQFNLGRKGNDSYLDVRDLGELFYQSQEDKFANSRIVQQLWNSYGKAAGFSNPALGNLTYDGNLPMNTREQVQEIRKTITQKMIDKSNQYLGGSNDTMYIRASEAQRLANFQPGNDLFNTMLRKAAMTGWQNPGLLALGVRGPTSEDAWNSIFNSDQDKRAMETGRLVEQEWANIPAVQKGTSFLGIHAEQTVNPRMKIKGQNRTYETTVKPDFLKVEETPDGFKLRITDTKNINASGRSSFNMKDLETKMRSEYGLQQDIYGFALSDRSNLSPEMKALFGNEKDLDEATRHYLDPNYKQDAKVSLETNVLATQSGYKIGDSFRKKIRSALTGFGKGEMITEGAAFVNLQPMTEMTEDFRNTLKSNILTQLEKAGQNLEENILPAAYYERGILKQALTERYPGVAVGTELTINEKSALAKFGLFDKDKKVDISSVAKLNAEELQSRIREVGSKIESFQAFSGSGPEGGGGNLGGGSGNKPPFGTGLFDSPDDSGGKKKRPTNAQVERESKGTPLQAMAQREMKSGGNSFFDMKKLTPEQREVAFSFVQARQQDYGQMVEGNFVPGPLVQEISGLQGKLAQYFAPINPQLSTEITNAKGLSQALVLAQNAGNKMNIGFQDMIKAVSPMVYNAAKETPAYKIWANEMTRNAAVMSSGAQSAIEANKPVLLGMGAQAGGNEQVLGNQAILSVLNDQMKVSQKFSKSGSSPIDQGERIVMARQFQAFEDYKKSFEQHVGTLKSAGKSLEVVNKELQDIAKSSDDIKSGKASEALKKFAEATTDLKNAETMMSKKVTGDWKETLTPAEKEVAKDMIRTTKMPKDLTKQYMAAEAKMIEAEDAMREVYEPSGKKGELSLGSLGRKMLGGFGLMYMGSIANIATTPLKFGYQESFQREAAFGKAFGVAGGPMDRDIEGDIAYQKSLYGGTGWRQLRGIYSDIVRNDQRLAEGINVGQAALGTGAMVGWIGNMAGVAASTLNPLMLGAGVLGGAVALGLGTYGAYQQTDENALSVFSQTLKKNYSILDQTGNLDLNKAGNAKISITSALGYKFNEQQQDIGEKLNALREFYKSGGKDGSDFLQKRGSSTEEAQKLVKMYSQAAGGLSEMGYPMEAYAAAGSLLNKYDISLSGTSPLDKMASLYAQGIDPESVATLYTASQFNTFQQTKNAAGQFITDMQSGARDVPTTTDIALMQSGAERYQALGTIAPQLKGAELEKYKKSLAGGTSSQWQAFGIAATLAQLAQGRGEAFSLPDVKDFLTIPDEERKEIRLSPESEEDYKQRILDETVKQLRGGKWGSEKNMTADWVEEGINKSKWQKYYNETEKTLPKKFTPQTYIDEVIPGTEGMTEEEAQKYIRENQGAIYSSQLKSQVTQGYQQLGFKQSPIDVSKMTNSEMLYRMQMQEFAKGIGVQLQGAGVNDQKLVQELSLLKGTQGSAVKRLLSMDANQWATMLQGSPELGSMMMPTASGTQIPVSAFGMVGYDMAGRQSGLSFGATSLNSATATGLQNAERIWGAKGTWGNYGAGEGLIGAMVEGFTDKSGRTYGGVAGAQLYMNEQQYNISMGQVGIQQRQIALQRAFTTGVGLDAYAGTVNPQTGQPFGINTSGGGFWGVEDRSRQLGYRQTEYAYGMQERQMNMNDKFFWQNFGTNYQQAMQQRAWTQQDYGVQDLTRNLQWSWKQEDYQENVRFMTGRDRRLAERQMRRETTMHDIEGTQIDTQRERQQELWDLKIRGFQFRRINIKNLLIYRKSNLLRTVNSMKRINN
jgi:hypothetical protein